MIWNYISNNSQQSIFDILVIFLVKHVLLLSNGDHKWTTAENADDAADKIATTSVPPDAELLAFRLSLDRDLISFTSSSCVDEGHLEIFVVVDFEIMTFVPRLIVFDTLVVPVDMLHIGWVLGFKLLVGTKDREDFLLIAAVGGDSIAFVVSIHFFIAKVAWRNKSFTILSIWFEIQSDWTIILRCSMTHLSQVLAYRSPIEKLPNCNPCLLLWNHRTASLSWFIMTVWENAIKAIIALPTATGVWSDSITKIWKIKEFISLTICHGIGVS